MIGNSRKLEIIDKLMEYVSEHCFSENEEYHTFKDIIGLSEYEMQELGIVFESKKYTDILNQNSEDIMFNNIERTRLSNLGQGIAEEIVYRYDRLKDDGIVNYDISMKQLESIVDKFMDNDGVWEEINVFIDDHLIDLEKESYKEYRNYCMEEYMLKFDKAEYEILYNKDELQKFQSWYEEKVFYSFKLLLEDCGFEIKQNDDKSYSLVDIMVESNIEKEKFYNLVDIISRLDDGASYIEDNVIHDISSELSDFITNNEKIKILVSNLEKNINDWNYNQIADELLNLIDIEPKLKYLKNDAEVLKFAYYGDKIAELKDSKLINKYLFQENESITNNIKYENIIQEAMKDTNNGNFCFSFQNIMSQDELKLFVQLLQQDNRVADVEYNEKKKEIDVVFYLENCHNLDIEKCEEDEEL